MPKFIKLFYAEAGIAETDANQFLQGTADEIEIEFIEARPSGETHNKVLVCIQYTADEPVTAEETDIED